MSELEDIEEIKKLKDGSHCYFNMFQGGGVACHKCNGMYLLFSVPLYGGVESYEGTYYGNQISEMVELAYSWT